MLHIVSDNSNDVSQIYLLDGLYIIYKRRKKRIAKEK